MNGDSSGAGPRSTLREAERIRSYKMRRGRIGPTAGDALRRLAPLLGVPVDGRPLEPAALFGRSAPLVLDIGFGRGEATAALAAADPARDVLAVEVHTPGVGNLLGLVESHGLTNVRVAEGDAVVLLRDMLATDSLDEVRIWFPDPWPKVRHHKRRLVAPHFLDLLASRLAAGATLHVATDWSDYARMAHDNLLAHSRFRVESTERPQWRPVTRFERIGREAGRPSYDVVARRI